MRSEAARRDCSRHFPGRWRTGAALIVAVLALGVAAPAFVIAQQPDKSREALLEPGRSKTAAEDLVEQSFFVLPIRTDLQRELLANGKPVSALVELNGFVTMGKKGVERMRALDILALRRALAQIKAHDQNAAVVFVIGFLGIPGAHLQHELEEEHKLLTKECRDMAKEAKLTVTQISGTYMGTPGVWPKVVAAANAIDFSQDTDQELPATDGDVRAFPVYTKVSRLLTGWCRGGTEPSSDCVVYLGQPIHASDTPLIGPALEARIAGVIKKLDLPHKGRIDYHLIVRNSDRAAWQRDRDAIYNLFLGKEANALTQRLGFKDSSITW